jgi:hypothetical protein
MERRCFPICCVVFKERSLFFLEAAWLPQDDLEGGKRWEGGLLSQVGDVEALTGGAGLLYMFMWGWGFYFFYVDDGRTEG